MSLGTTPNESGHAEVQACILLAPRRVHSHSQGLFGSTCGFVGLNASGTKSLQSEPEVARTYNSCEAALFIFFLSL